MEPKISVIVPVYNVEKYLDRCVQSILNQSFTDFELLLVDDGSSDSSGAICDQYAVKDERIRAFHKENGGVSSARNMGLDYARGEWIAFVDSDDWVEPLMYEKMYHKAVKEHADVCVCDFHMISDSKKYYYASSVWTADKKASMQAYLKSVWTVIWNLLARKELCRKNNLQFPLDIVYCEDFCFAVRLMYEAEKIVNIHEAFYNYYQHPSSVMHSLNEKAGLDEQNMYLDTIEWFKQEGVYADYEKQMCWRILKNKQDCLLDRKTYQKFINLVPESKKYILSCPYLNVKLKIMGWCLTHHLQFVSRFFLWMRKLRLNKSRRVSV